MSLDLTTARYVSTDRTAPAAKGQVRVWVTVAPGEEIMLKLEAGADVAAETERHMARLRSAASAEKEAAAREVVPRESVAVLRALDLPEELARVEAEIARLTECRAALVTRTDDIARVR